jgi:hypothetical protein
MSSIGDILGKKSYDEPPEVQPIKRFALDNFRANVNITVQPKQIIISAPSAALVGTLRMHSHELAKLCQTDKRLIFRVSQ